jgi:hypothetical protein
MSYEIADEPVDSGQFGNLAVSPEAPLLAAMMAGAWMSWPWFIVNSLAIGSPTRRREISLVLLGFVGSVILGMFTYTLVDAGIIVSTVALQLALLVITAWKLAVAYYVSIVQGRTFHVFQYYGGRIRQPWGLLVLGMQLRWLVVDASENPIWRVIVSGLL